MTSADEAVADLVQGAIAQVEQHRQLVERLTALANLAASCISTHDVGQKLLAELGDENKVKNVLQRNSDLLNKAFTDWYIAARIAAHEGRKLK